MIILNILGAWLLADFLSGVAHWAQDKILVYGTNKFFDMVIGENVLHHNKPAPWKDFLILQNIQISVVTTWPVALGLYLLHAPTFLWLGIFFLSFGNLVHFFAHQRQVPRVIRALQRIGIFASFEHHKGHHTSGGRLTMRENASVRYCVMTNWVNLALDRVRFFEFLEGGWRVLVRRRFGSDTSRAA